MQLVEREGFLKLLRMQFQVINNGEGRCVFVSGEAGIGKTSLVNTFCEGYSTAYKILKGFCDALFSPRLLAPLYDIILQVKPDTMSTNTEQEQRSELFSGFFQELAKQKEKFIILFEDIHWADEATLDFIKFFARRITQVPCLFLLTYRDDEIHSGHSLRNLTGQLAPDTFTRIRLTPLSREVVETMAAEKGYSGEDVYNISGGNPFYVNEILSSYSAGIPDNIRDAVISVYNRQEDMTRRIWEILSVVPDRFEIKYLEKMEPQFATAIERSLETRILLMQGGYIFFKHELFRRTIENFLSPFKRVSLNKRILELFLENFKQNNEIERIIHHAKNANEYEAVATYAPIAALKAASMGAHREASKLYSAAIEYYQENDKDLLIQLYESFAYECYLTNQLNEAIIYTEKSLKLWKEKNDRERRAGCLRFLSRLWWLNGNRTNAEIFGGEAVEILAKRPASPAKAMAFSNMSQLNMLCDKPDLCVEWGEKAIALAREMDDSETLSHALNNVGSVKMNLRSSEETGIALLQQSLQIALKKSMHEHAARAYSNLGSNWVKIKNFPHAKKILDEGIKYCEERDLEAWRSNMHAMKARLFLETGEWNSAAEIAEKLMRNEFQLTSFSIPAMTVLATIRMRRGEDEVLPLLFEAESRAFETLELQRIVPVLIALLEYEWLMGKSFIKSEKLDHATTRIEQSIYSIEKSEFAFWLSKARNQDLKLKEIYEGYDLNTITKARKAAAIWMKLGSPFSESLCLFQGNDDDKRNAIIISDRLGATAVCDKMKLEMRNAGIKSIPRGIRKTTRANPSYITARELDILYSLKDGLQNKEISAKLYISVRTVDKHITSLFFKLNVNSRIKAVAEAVRQGIIK